MLLVDALRDPASTTVLDTDGWTALLAMARAEQLIGTLARRLSGLPVSDAVARILDEARVNAEYQRRSALWEADCARRALADYDGKIVLMKGTAYAAAGLKASEGRHIGDLDIMVAREDLPVVEAALLAAGWEWVKDDAYDDAYYRDHMHELPPLIHRTRDRMIDVHHTILPLTARPTPDAPAMLADAEFLPSRLREGPGEGASIQANSDPPLTPPASGRGIAVFCPTDMVIHSAAHLFADGELDGGLRNLWDIHCLLSDFADEAFWPALNSRAHSHGLWPAVHRAARLAHRLYATEIPQEWQSWHRQDKCYVMRLTARDNWGRGNRKFTRLIFYIRSHWLRMPPLMLARHLWTKWRKA
jgi:Uncharacterised nucleotidyltransferase